MFKLYINIYNRNQNGNVFEVDDPFDDDDEEEMLPEVGFLKPTSKTFKSEADNPTTRVNNNLKL